MKKFHQFFLGAMALLLFTASLTVSAFASEDKSSQTLKFEDGSYIVITIEYDRSLDGASCFASRSTKSGTKTYTYYDSSDALAWEFRVHGTFTYNGLTATAIGASYSYNLYDGTWSFIDGSATYADATATATGRFRQALFPYTVTISLTCSSSGVLS